MDAPPSNLISRGWRYAQIGILGAVVYYGLLWFLVELAGLAVMIATAIAFIVVVLENYFLHYRWTFLSSQSHTRALPWFVAMSFIGFWLNLAIMYLGVERIGLSYLSVQAVAIAVVLAWNFVISSLWIFSRNPDSSMHE